MRGSAIWNETEADRQVMMSMLREIIKRLGDRSMSTLLTDAGKLYSVHEFEELTLENAQKLADTLQADLTKVQTWIAQKQQEVQTPTAPTEPVNPAPGAAVDPTVAAPAAPAEPTPPAAPTDPTVQPTIDPNQVVPAPQAPAAPAEPAVLPPLQ